MRPDIRRLAAETSARFSTTEIEAFFENPVFIVSAPRSGSTVLFRTLMQSPSIWTIGTESHRVFAQFPHLRAQNKTFDSGRLGPEHADPETCERLRLHYFALLQDSAGAPLREAARAGAFGNPVFLEKTPRNSLNIGFLTTVFPRARFIYLHRDARENIASIIEAWRVGGATGQFVTFRNLPDWPPGYWCFMLPPGWRALKGGSFAEIAAFQWRACNEIIMDDLSALPRERWTMIAFDDFIDAPRRRIDDLNRFCGADAAASLPALTPETLPASPTTITPPRKDKWRQREAEILPLLSGLEATIARIAAFG